MTPYLRPIAVALALGLAIVAPGCDDDDDVTTPAPIESPTPAPTPTPTPTPSPTPTPDDSPDTGEETVFVGEIQALSAPEMTVSDRRVVTDAGTEYGRSGPGSTGASFDDFSVGETVRVHGTVQDDDSVRATRISLELPQP
jgi:hypothetical protein